MKNRALKAIAVFFTLTVLRPVAAAAGEYPVNQPKRVLVELFTSQGCSSCATRFGPPRQAYRAGR